MTGPTASNASFPPGNFPVHQGESSQEPSILSTVGSALAQGAAFNFGGTILGKVSGLGSKYLLPGIQKGAQFTGSAFSSCRDAVTSTANNVWPRVEPYAGMMVSGMVTGAGAAEKFLSYNNPQVVKNLCSTLVSYAAPVAVAGGKVVGKLPFAGPMIVKAGGKMALTAATYPHLVALLGAAGVGIYLYNRCYKQKKPEPDMKSFKEDLIKVMNGDEKTASSISDCAQELRKFDLGKPEKPLSIGKVDPKCAMALAVAIMSNVEQSRKPAVLCLDPCLYKSLEDALKFLAGKRGLVINPNPEKKHESVQDLWEWAAERKKELQQKSPDLKEFLDRHYGISVVYEQLMAQQREQKKQGETKVKSGQGTPDQILAIEHHNQDQVEEKK